MHGDGWAKLPKTATLTRGRKGPNRADDDRNTSHTTLHTTPSDTALDDSRHKLPHTKRETSQGRSDWPDQAPHAHHYHMSGNLRNENETITRDTAERVQYAQPQTDVRKTAFAIHHNQEQTQDRNGPSTCNGRVDDEIAWGLDCDDVVRTAKEAVEDVQPEADTGHTAPRERDDDVAPRDERVPSTQGSSDVVDVAELTDEAMRRIARARASEYIDDKTLLVEVERQIERFLQGRVKAQDSDIKLAFCDNTLIHEIRNNLKMASVLFTNGTAFQQKMPTAAEVQAITFCSPDMRGDETITRILVQLQGLDQPTRRGEQRTPDRGDKEGVQLTRRSEREELADHLGTNAGGARKETDSGQSTLYAHGSNNDVAAREQVLGLGADDEAKIPHSSENGNQTYKEAEGAVETGAGMTMEWEATSGGEDTHNCTIEAGGGWIARRRDRISTDSGSASADETPLYARYGSPDDQRNDHWMRMSLDDLETGVRDFFMGTEQQ
jgi:hypothetical protein